MLSTNANFDALHDLDHKWPMYLIHFDGEGVDYCNHSPGSPDNTLKKYLVDISGLDQKKTPQEGKSSIGGIRFELLDVDDEITALLATDTAAYFQGRKVTVKAGYLGMDEADMLTIGTNMKVNKLVLGNDGVTYIFNAADPMKKFQKILFRGADDSSVILQGNAINVLLSILTSSGSAGTNGDYDSLALVNGLNMDSTEIDITGMEDIRDNYYPGNSHYMHITITDKERANVFFEREFFKPFNLTPAVTADGKFTVKPYKPPLAATTQVQTFDEDIIEDLPEQDFSLPEMVNEVFFDYDHDGTDFQTKSYNQDSDSLTNRGQAKKAITIESKGLHSSVSGVSLNMYADDVAARRAKSIFQRYATPPLKFRFNTLFYQWLSEFGDVVPFTHSKMPDIVAGSRGFASERMEVIQKGVNWRDGEVKFELLDTGFAKGIYQQISPTMAITAQLSGSPQEFSPAVSGDDGYRRLPSVFNTNSDSMLIGDDGVNNNSLFVRFPAVTKGSVTVVSAVLQLTSGSNLSGATCNLNIYFNDEDDAAAPTNAAEFDGLSLTSPIAWVPGTWNTFVDYDTPELKTILQTIFDRGGWASGQALMMVIKDNASDGNAYRLARTIDAAGGSAKAILSITTISQTSFTVSSADAAKYANLTNPVVDIYDAGMRVQVSNKIITSVSGTTITIDDLGVEPTVGWIVVFSSYDNCTDEQKKFGFIADASNNLGAADDDAHLISP